MLSLDTKVNEGALNEKRLLNQDRLGEMPDPAELGPESDGENGTGSMLRSDGSAGLIRAQWQN